MFVFKCDRLTFLATISFCLVACFIGYMWALKDTDVHILVTKAMGLEIENILNDIKEVQQNTNNATEAILMQLPLQMEGLKNALIRANVTK
jgi:hypothetical protein